MRIFIKAVKIFLIFTICLSFGCSSHSITPPYYILSGICSLQTSYTPSTFIDSTTTAATFKNNNLDFWIFGTNAQSKSMSVFRDNIRTIGKKLKNHNLIEMPMITHSDTDYDSSTMIYNTCHGKPQCPVILRELGLNIAYETFHVKYNGEVNSYFEHYIKLLDSGYLLTPMVCAEIIGPEWTINSNFRINVKTKQNSRQAIIQAIADRHVYVSTLDNVSMQFNINNAEMGSIITDFSELSAEYNVSNRNTKINAVEILTNNNEIIFAQRNLSDNNVSRKINLPTDNDFSYFFLRVYFENGETSFSTPIWVIRQQQVLINSISSMPIVSTTSNYGISMSCSLENISDSVIDDLTYTITDSNGNTLETNTLMLRKRECRILKKEFYFDTPTDNITVTLSKDNFFQKQAIKLHNKKVGKIVFDAAHNNIFANDMKKAMSCLQEENHIVQSWNKIEQYYDYENLSKYDIIIITIPSRVVDLVDTDMKFFSRINKYVYNGGNVILAGYDSPDTKAPVIFMNEILRVLYSSLRYYINSKYSVSPMTDAVNNFMGEENAPVFSKLYDLDKFNSLSEIYFKNPIEFRSNTGIGVTKLYGTTTLVNFDKTTAVGGKIPKYTDNYSPAVIQSFGFGRIVVLSGINFTDYDIDNLDNKQWFINLINYLIKSND